jgi:hypothetical protein
MEKEYDEPEFAPITGRVPTVLEEQEQEALTRIASSKLGLQLSATASGKTLQPHLDPSSPHFDHQRWAQMVLNQVNESGIDIPHQGVVFSNLCISGSGSALQYQETLTSSLRVPFRAAVRGLTGRAPPPREILHSFDGLLQGGELLLVLGRPGSGCTTFLKTITGHFFTMRVSTSTT